MRIAAIDVGSNSIHMVIASAHRPPAFEVVDREREVVQIGRGSFARRRLRRDAMQRTALALRRFVQLARRLQAERILCTTTAAVREASNGGEFLQLCRELAGITPRIIPAAEEGRLIDLAVRSALRVHTPHALVVDVGGGSAQLVAGMEGRAPRVVSAPVGALRLTERFLQHDPPTPREISRLRRAIREELDAAFDKLGDQDGAQVYGSSGAVHALAHAAHWLDRGERVRQINGHAIGVDSLRRLTRRLLRMPLAQRVRLPEVDGLRAEIIVPGALVLLEVLERAGASHLTLSDFGLREGLVTDWLQHHVHEVSALDSVEDLRLRSVLALLAKFGPTGAHPEHVANLSLALFDGLAPEHGIDASARELLRFAALLHDVGSAIAYDGHAEHSRYVIRNGHLRGLSEEEVEVIANVARYHGKARPRKHDEGYRRLRKGMRRTVRWLAAMLRVAEGLDRSHYQLIRGLHVERRGGRISLHVRALRDAQLELWAARRRTRELERLLECEVRVRLEPRPERTARRAARTLSEPARRSSAAAAEASPAPRSAAGRPAPPRPSAPTPRASARGGSPASRGRAGARSSSPDRAATPAVAAARGPRPNAN